MLITLYEKKIYSNVLNSTITDICLQQLILYDILYYVRDMFVVCNEHIFKNILSL